MDNQQLISSLNENHLQAFLTTKGPNLQYLTGFTGGEGMAIAFESGRIVLLVDGRYTYQAQQETHEDAEVIEYQPKLLWGLVLQYLESSKYVGLEAETQLGLFQRLNEKIPHVEWKCVPDFFEIIRSIKNENEILMLKMAAQIANDAYLEMLKYVKPGISELELSALLEFEMKKRGGQKTSFDIIVASGQRSAMPHGVASPKIISFGDMVTFDFGVFYHGYASDTTRTVSVGKPRDEDSSRIYQIVLDAQNKAIEALEEGILCSEIDRIARTYIQEKGYGEFFKHSTGHGIGLEIHELPRISYECQTPLKEGMAITIEPGIYLDGRMGVRIEDSIIIEKDGILNLTPLEKNKLQIL